MRTLIAPPGGDRRAAAMRALSIAFGVCVVAGLIAVPVYMVVTTASSRCSRCSTWARWCR